jgi:hypothetical protein
LAQEPSSIGFALAHLQNFMCSFRRHVWLDIGVWRSDDGCLASAWRAGGANLVIPWRLDGGWVAIGWRLVGVRQTATSERTTGRWLTAAGLRLFDNSAAVAEAMQTFVPCMGNDYPRPEIASSYFSHLSQLVRLLSSYLRLAGPTG